MLLMNDSRYPWIVLVPQIPSISEIHEMSEVEFSRLMLLTKKTSRVLQELTGAIKMNIAALGNQTPQLHMHIVARFSNDAAWPQPVWGETGSTAYSKSELEAFTRNFLKMMSAG